MNNPLAQSVGEAPAGFIQDRVALAFQKADAERSAYLDKRCREEFSRENRTAEQMASAIAKARATRLANLAIRLARGEKR